MNLKFLRLQTIVTYLFILVLGASLASCASSKPRFGEVGYTEEGKASYYARKFQGRKMANGERYRRSKMIAAHKKLPFGTKVKVTNLNNNRSVKVKITDRGPFVRGRIIDLSEAAARKLGYINDGVAPVKMTVIQKASKNK